ncbi:hypothetical protein ABZY57_18385 [Streptomyces sp. NPDC006450]|uniref:hypothetical protein n=1 Tax=Streptomyces sp. NPDC006450 TaxID=3155458 RepID=UPI0033B7A391
MQDGNPRPRSETLRGRSARHSTGPPNPVPRLWTGNFGLCFTARVVSMLRDTMMRVAVAVAVAVATAMIPLGYGVSGIGYALGARTGSSAPGS